MQDKSHLLTDQTVQSQHSAGDLLPWLKSPRIHQQIVQRVYLLQAAILWPVNT